MDVNIRTGRTEMARDVLLSTHSLTSATGEPVSFLLQAQAKAKDAKAVEEECLRILQHALLDADGEATKRLDSTLKELNGFLKGCFVSGTLEDIHMIVALLDTDSVLHVSHAGTAEAYLVRRGVANPITESGSPKDAPAFVHVASGQLEARDLVIFATERLLRTVTLAQLAKLAQQEGELMDEIVRLLEADHEFAAIAIMRAGRGQAATEASDDDAPPEKEKIVARLRRGRSQSDVVNRAKAAAVAWGAPALSGFLSLGKRVLASSRQAGMSKVTEIIADLHHPKRRSRAHFFLLAGAVGVLLIVWVVVRLTITSQRSKTQTELEALVTQITTEVQSADNRRLTGDIDGANAILDRAEERAKQVMDNESGLFRVEALELLERIRSKKEEINNIIRPSLRVAVNLSSKAPDIIALGFLGLEDGEFVAYDRQGLYRALANTVENPVRLSESDLIVDGTDLPRYQALVFLTNGNSVVEVQSSQLGTPIAMKTDDPAGWAAARDAKGYLRNLYLLAPEANQIYKYERLTNRYGPRIEYNVSGDIRSGLDMAIDGNVYVLKEGGTIVKLFRGEVQNFTIRRAPEGALKNATKIFKAQTGNFYFLDPVGNRVIVTTDGGATGESTYLRQYVLEGEQITALKDLYVDPEEAYLYVLDDKRIYIVDLGAK